MDIVEKEGWESFCSCEMVVLEVVMVFDVVIVIGGGIILVEYNCCYMCEKGIVIYFCVFVVVLVGCLEVFLEEG